MISPDVLVNANEIVNFLQTVTIKFHPFAKIVNQTLKNSGYTNIQEDNLSTWKYYLNAQGRYHETDELMYVTSLDTGLEIAYTTETLKTHPKTRAAYIIGRAEYTNLCLAYPAQTDLIKSITYPVTDIDRFLEADDLTLHAYGTGILEAAEEAMLVSDYVRFLNYIRERWYLEEMGYEERYYDSFWSIVLYMSVAYLFGRRISYLKTEYAHSFHIWEHLRSKGLSDYRDILSARKAAFLYKNIDYLQDNAGKVSTLDILTENILGDLAVGMVGSTIFQSLENTQDEALWIPKILSLAISAKDVSKFEDGDPVPISDMVARLYNEGYDVDGSADHAVAVTEELRATNLNILQTKILEIKKYSIDDKYQSILDRFVLDKIITHVNDGTYTGSISITDEYTGLPINISYKDALLLFHYACLRANNTNYFNQHIEYDSVGNPIVVTEPSVPAYPDKLPTTYEVSALFRKAADISPDDFPEYIWYHGHKYKLSNYVDVQAILDSIPRYDASISSPLVFEKHIHDQFMVMIDMIRTMRKTGDLIKNKCLFAVYSQILTTGMIEISLSPLETYNEWIATLPASVQTTLSTYDMNATPHKLYDVLSSAVLDNIVPISMDIFGPFALDTEATNQMYIRLKQLFVQLCSYTILFLDTDRRENDWAMIVKIAIAMHIDIYETIWADDINRRKTARDATHIQEEIDLVDMILDKYVSTEVYTKDFVDVVPDVKTSTIIGQDYRVNANLRVKQDTKLSSVTRAHPSIFVSVND